MFLNCHSYHSLRYGTLSIDALVQQAYESGTKELVLTDINTVTGIYEFKKKCEKYGIKPIAGVEVRKGNKLLYIAVAKAFSGIGEINRVLTAHSCDGAELTEKAPLFEQVFVIYPITNIPETLNEHEFIGLREEELNLMIRPDFKSRTDKMVVLHPITFSTKKEYNLHRVLRAIENNTLLSKLSEDDICSKSEYLKSEASIIQSFSQYPEIIRNTKKILSKCSFEFTYKERGSTENKNKKYFTS